MKTLRALLVGLAATGASVTARATSVSPSLESLLYARVGVDFQNTGTRECRVTKYVVTWPGGTKKITPASDLVVPAGQTVARTVRVDEMSDKIPATDVTVTATCA